MFVCGLASFAPSAWTVVLEYCLVVIGMEELSPVK